MAKKLVLIGGGHAHMVTLSQVNVFIGKGHEVTVVGPSCYHYYSGMGPGMLGTTYSPSEIRFATKDVVEKQGATFILDYADRVDPVEKVVFLASGKIIPYDILSFNAGSYVDRSCVVNDSGDIFSVKPIETLMQAQKRLVELASGGCLSVGIVGGGPSSAEIAGNIIQLLKAAKVNAAKIIIFSGREFMGRFPLKVRQLVMDSLEKRGVEIRQGCRVSEVESGQITQDDGQVFHVDLVFLALGVKPSSIFKKSGLPVGPDGGLLVNKFLQCPEYPDFFGGGDCIYFSDRPLDKVGVYAVRENPVLFHNLLAALENRELEAFHPGGDYLLIFNLGEGIGVLRKSWITFGGRVAFRVKDYIDRKFMKRFQALEQSGEDLNTK